MRLLAERVARAVGVSALMVALASTVWQAARANAGASPASAGVLTLDATNRDAASVAATVRSRIIADVRRRASAPVASAAAEPPVIRVRLDVVPSGVLRSILAATAQAGISVTWHNASGVQELAVDASRRSTPAVGSQLTVRATLTDPADTVALVVRDAGGMLDSIVEGQAGALSTRLALLGDKREMRGELVRRGDVLAAAFPASPDSARVGRVRLYAAPGWDGKFVTAALEEHGWRVDGTYQIAPTSMVRVGQPTSLDTSRYSAAVILDSGLADPRALRAFIVQGGGVVVAGNALRDPVLSTLAAARIADERAAIAGALLTDRPRRGLPAVHLAVAPQVTVLEREGQEAVVTVIRRNVGRVLAAGFRESWHWRMEGTDESAAAHRDWWNALVATVAFVAPVAPPTAVARSRWPGDAAPLADLVARMGASETLPLSDGARVPDATGLLLSRLLKPWLLFTLAAAGLIAEWMSRRLRGSP